MSIILQSSTSRQFVAGHETAPNWSYDQKFARAFDTGVEAYDYCRDKRLSDMNIILTFTNSAYNVEVPVRNR